MDANARHDRRPGGALRDALPPLARAQPYPAAMMSVVAVFVRVFVVLCVRMPASKARGCSRVSVFARLLGERTCAVVDCRGVLFVHFAQTRAEKHFLLAGNFNKAVSGGFASPFGAGGGLEDSLMEGDDSAYPSGF